MEKYYILLAIVLFISIVLIILLSRPSYKLSNGSTFPYKTTLEIINNTGFTLKNVSISDAKGNDYKMPETWLNKMSIYIYIPVYNNYEQLEIYGINQAESEEFTLQMVNIDNKVVFQYLYQTPLDSIIISTSSHTGIKPIFMYENTIYKVKEDTLSSGDDFPVSFNLLNNTTNGEVVDNSSNTSGTDPNVDKIIINELYVTDSLQHVYADVVNNVSFTNKKNTNTGNLLQHTLLFQFPKPIPKSHYVQIYMVDSDQNSYNIVLYNDDGNVVITYSSNIDPSAFPILSVKSMNNHVRCNSLMPLEHKPEPGKMTASFRSTALWPENTTLKIGFVDGQPWMWAWVMKNIKEQIEPFINLPLNFVVPPNNTVVPLDETYQIRIGFDPNGGAFSSLGKDSLLVPVKDRTFNLSFLDIPFSTTFSFNGVSYVSPASGYDQGYINGPYGSTILHEFCHALGMQHEHTNSFNNPINYDKKKVYEYYQGPPNNWNKEQIDFNVLNLNNPSDSEGSDFDPYSIMRYKIETRFLLDPTPDILAWGSTDTFVLTNCDKAYLNKMYPGKVLPNNLTCTLSNHARPTPPIVISN